MSSSLSSARYGCRSVSSLSDLEALRQRSSLRSPSILQAANALELDILKAHTESLADQDALKQIFPKTYGQPLVVLKQAQSVDKHPALKIGVVLSGGQAAGGHNVICGIFDFLQRRAGPGSRLYGFLDGPQGIYKGEYMELQAENIDGYRNQGGFDIIGSGRHKIETEEQFRAAAKVCSSLELDGLVVIGGDDSNTNAALLAESFLKQACHTRVVGVPKTIDGDLKNELIELSFGFDSACKQYAELVGNVMIDCNASKKYYHFVRLMGRAASHITLEVALQTRPTVALVGEEIYAKRMSLSQITHDLCDVIVSRAASGRHFGVILLPEGLIEFVPEVHELINELNELLSQDSEAHEDHDAIAERLSFNAAALFKFLPANIRHELMLDRDPHGNVQVAKIETEKLLISLCEHELEQRRKQNRFSGRFITQTHYFGYEGRCALPSQLDSTYCYSLGVAAGALLSLGLTGYMSAVNHLTRPAEEWTVGGVPLTMMMNVERRKGHDKPVIRKYLVELEGALFKAFERLRGGWQLTDSWRNPGPMQFDGPTADDITFTLWATVKTVDELVIMIQPELISTEAVYQAAPSVTDSATVTLAKSQMWSSSKCESQYSPLQRLRLNYVCQLPFVLQQRFKVVEGDAPGQLCKDGELLESLFPRTSHQPLLEVLPDTLNTTPSQQLTPVRIGIVFCGRQCPGGHNVVAGAFDYLQKWHPGSTLVGFLGGTVGLQQGLHTEVTASFLDGYRNQGGFDMLGRSVDKLNTPDQLEATRRACESLKLDGLLMVGGSYSCTDAALLAEYLIAKGCRTGVVGVPGTVDGDMGGPFIECPFGFDTACKVFSQVVGNIAIDANSAKKYWYFVRLMGRSASHIALECALQTRPNVVIIGEEVEQRKHTLADITRTLCDAIDARAKLGKHYGVILIPEGLLGRVPEVSLLIKELNCIVAQDPHVAMDNAKAKLTPWSLALFEFLPKPIQQQLLLERESHGTIQLTQIQTEKLLEELVTQELSRRKSLGLYKGTFASICHFIGYQGRSSMPSNFDCNLAYTLGMAATLFVSHGYSGVLPTVRGLNAAPNMWTLGAVPLSSLMRVERDTEGAAVAQLDAPEVRLDGRAFEMLRSHRSRWLLEEQYRNPGPIQFAGPTADRVSVTLREEQHNMMEKLHLVYDLCREVKKTCRLGYSPEVLDAAVVSLKSLQDVLNLLNKRHNPAASDSHQRSMST
eukprot:GILK01004615.1.p1 GENE.GILK01004615.1~~GILK01004615.1.p1  ORF type:complete len:1223 (-),score=232.86 GILK01004615.1:147-3782(-)